MDLFSQSSTDAPKEFMPLAERARPRTLAEYVGQEHLVGAGQVVERAIKTDQLFSMLFWGPPAVGKTTLARIIASETKSEFHGISAVTAGVADLKRIILAAKINRQMRNRRTILFVDEIHRFNKAQQDALLHSVEDGTLVLVGATTENPSFEVNSALLSRCQVFQLNPLSLENIRTVVQRVLVEDSILQVQQLQVADDVVDFLIKNVSSGDVRGTLNTLELAANTCPVNENGERVLTKELIANTAQRRYVNYDKQGDAHYDTISAFIKSIRGSDPDAALHYLARMLEAGEDPKFIARRLVIAASEDIGNAAPMALVLATAAFTAVTYVGMPEAQIILGQATTYLAGAEKSNAAYLGIKEARADIQKDGVAPIPLHLRNAPTKLMAQFGYADGYQYPHDYPDHFVRAEYFPKKMVKKNYYRPSANGFEIKIRDRLKRLWPKRGK